MNFKVGDKLICKEDIMADYSNDVFIKDKEYGILRVLIDADIILINTHYSSSQWFSFSMVHECFYTQSEIREIKLEKINYGRI